MQLTARPAPAAFTTVITTKRLGKWYGNSVKEPLSADDIVHFWIGVCCFICTLNFQMQHQIIHTIPFKPMTSFFHFHILLPARAEMRHAARQVDNDKALRQMDNVSKTKAIKVKARADISDSARHEQNAKVWRRRAKTSAEMSDAARQEQNAKTRKRKAKARAEMSDAARQENNAKKRMAKARAEMSDAARQENNA